MIRKSTIRLAAVSALLAATAIGGAATAQYTIDDPTKLQPVPNDYQPEKTAWGDPDLQGMWPAATMIPLLKEGLYPRRIMAGMARRPSSVTEAPTIPVAVANSVPVTSVATPTAPGMAPITSCTLRKSLSRMPARSTI